MKRLRTLKVAVVFLALFGFANFAQADFYCYVELFDYADLHEIWDARVEIRVMVDNEWTDWVNAGVVDGNCYGWHFLSYDATEIQEWQVHVFEQDTQGYEGYTGRIPETQIVSNNYATTWFNWFVTKTT